ncbi:MAG: pilus assembly protein PilM [Patescibacteria group bacterium]
MHTSTFFRLFPPPKFLAMKHAGLDISDEAIHCLEYHGNASNTKVEKYARFDLPPGLIEGGEFRNEEALVQLLTTFNKKYHLSYVKVSIPEEKVYLFQTDVPSNDTAEVRQNIEFKLEENVPLPASEALFSFDLMPISVTKGTLRASVSVVPQAYILQYMHILERAGMSAIEFEVVPKSIARAAIPHESEKTHLIVHMMKYKTGLYIISDGVVCFTSTVGNGAQAGTEADGPAYVANLSKEINRVYQYWGSHGGAESPIQSVLLTGAHAAHFESQLQNIITSAVVPVQTAHVWQNVFNIDKYVPPISQEESLDYAVAAGLAMNLLI